MSGCENEDYSILGQCESVECRTRVEVRQVVVVEFVKGFGQELDDPVRACIAIYTMDGECIAVRDTWKEQHDEQQRTAVVEG